jgi:hypothetical protein
MEVGWTEISAFVIAAFSCRYPISISKKRDVTLLVHLMWQMTDKNGSRIGIRAT